MASASAAPNTPAIEHGRTTPAKHHRVNYVAIFLLLVGLTAVTVAVALKRFESEWINLLLALTIASVKAAFVAMYFMHLKFEGKLIYFILFIPLSLCVILIVALIPDIVMAH